MPKRARDLGRRERARDRGQSGRGRTPTGSSSLSRNASGQPAGRHGTEGVAVAPGVLGGDQPPSAASPDPDRSPLGDELLRERRIDLVRRAIASAQKEVVQLVGGSGPSAQLGTRPLRSRRDRGGRGAPRRRAAHAGGRGRARAPAHDARPSACRPRTCTWRRSRRAATRRTATPRPSRRRRGRGGALRGRRAAGAAPACRTRPQALAVGLEHDREVRVAARHLQQALRFQPLLPERRPLAGAPPRDEQRAAGVLAEARAEERASRRAPARRGPRPRRATTSTSVVGRRRLGVREVQRDPVVGPDRVHLEPERVAQACGEGERPGRVHPAAEGRQDAEPPVADLVAEALDDNRPIGRERPGGLLLLAQVGERGSRRRARRGGAGS